MEITQDSAKSIALAFYKQEPCRICGYIIGMKDLANKNFVFAGYSKGNITRAAHSDCWNSNVPKYKWKYPEDAED